MDDGPADLVLEPVSVGGRTLELLRPRDSEALLHEHAFEHEEYLPYWAELWPSALALADAVAGAGANLGPVHELGCGLGVPALVAALAGADVLATDWSPAAVQLLRRNADRCGAALHVRRWSWTESADALGPARPLVLAADVLYERRNGPQLLRVLPGLVADGGEAWIADPGRAPAADFLAAAAQDWALGEVAHEGPASVTVHRLTARDG